MSNSTMISAAAIPASSRKVVQSLKEIVNCPEQEIYSMLKECNMDPDDTINRLLSQDTFQEVKTKRERKKEVKASESRSHGIKSDVYASHNGQDGDVWGWDSELEKPQLFSSTSRTTTKQTNPLPQSYISHSESISAINQEQSIGTGDWPVFENPHLSAQPSSGSQPAWTGVPGHASMADVVRMGKPSDKWSNVLTMSETISEPVSTVGQHANHVTWPVLEQSRATSVASDTEVCSYPSSSQSSRANLPHKVNTSQVVQASDDVPAYSGQVVMETAQGVSHQESVALNDMNSYYSTGYSFEQQEALGVIGGSKSHVPNFSAPLTDDLNIAVSSTSASFQQLGLGNNDSKVRPVDNNAVIIPSHLQDLVGDCSHLTFGTLKFGNGWEVNSSSSSTPIKSDLEKFTSAAMNRSSYSHLENSTGDYHSDEQLRSMYDSHRVHMDRQAYDSTIASRSEFMNPTMPESTQLGMDRQACGATITSRSELWNPIPESAQLQQDVFPSSLHGYDIENRQQLSSTLPYTILESTELQQDVFPSSIHSYENRQQLRSKLPYVQSNRPTVDTSTFSSGMSNSRAGITTGPTTQQSLNSYSQASYSMGQASNLDNYLIQPRTNAYSQSAIQQAYSGDNLLQSLEALESAGLLQSQYKNSSSVNNLPQSAVKASGYGQYGSSTPTGNFLKNPSANPTYDDILSSIYKGGNQYRMPQQNESSTMAGYVPSSITHPSVPSSLYYELQRHNQNQEPVLYRQGQHQAMQQRYGGPEQQYQTYYHLQKRTQDDEQHKYFTANGIHGLSSNQSQNNWQHKY